MSSLLHRSWREVDLIQAACQRHVDERQDYDEARSLLELIHHDSTTDTNAANDGDGDGDMVAKRKRRKWKIETVWSRTFLAYAHR